jgi:hypothetical protein
LRQIRRTGLSNRDAVCDACQRSEQEMNIANPT